MTAREALALAEKNMTNAEILETLAPHRNPLTWCLCRNTGCLGWSAYLKDCQRVFGRKPTEDEMTDDAKIRKAVKALAAGGVQ